MRPEEGERREEGAFLAAELVSPRDGHCPSADADAFPRRDCSRGIRSSGLGRDTE